MVRTIWQGLIRWLNAGADPATREIDPLSVDWVRIIPFIGMHVACLAVLWVGWSATAVVVAIALYMVRMFALTGAYHRYFSHRTYRTSRWFQFVLAALGNSAVQRGPLWWAAHHRHHHRHSDTEEDFHAPTIHGFWWSHMGWITSRKAFPTDMRAVPDLAKYPELVFLNRYDVVIPIFLAVALFALGAMLERFAPSLGTSGQQMLVWGFFVSTIVLFHGTCTINSLAHLMGRRRYATDDHSRNSFLLALITLGEGWHNNHHRYPGTVRQGFFWWEVDITYYVLWGLSKVGLIWDLSPVPSSALSTAAERAEFDNQRSEAIAAVPRLDTAAVTSGT